jgi:hypothetical protein
MYSQHARKRWLPTDIHRVTLEMVSHEQKAITKKRTTWYTVICTSQKGIVSKRHFSADGQLYLGWGRNFLSFNYHIYIVT